MKRALAGYLATVTTFLVGAASAAAPQEMPLRGIWISPPSSSAVIPSVVRQIAAAGLNAVVVPVFYDGRVTYPSRVFPQHAAYLGSDPAAILIQEAHRRGLRVFAALDVLYWQSSATPSPAVANHPEWLERTAEGAVIGDAAGKPGAFVSPCEPRVGALLVELATELASRYDFDGVVLDYARWSRLDFLGYATADRKLYLEQQQTDPLDIDLLGYATPAQMVSALVRWQEQQITAVTRAAAQAFKRGEPRGAVFAVVEPGYYANRERNPARQEWRSWLGQGWLTAVMPYAIDYADPESVRARLRAASGLERPPVVALIRCERLPLGPQIEAAMSLGLHGFIIWARDSLAQRQAILSELGVR